LVTLGTHPALAFRTVSSASSGVAKDVIVAQRYLAKMNFPLSLSLIVTKNIQTDILVNQNLLWNVTLIYSFNKKYVEQ